MEILTRAQQFFAYHSRDIDRACLDYHFGTRSLDELLTTLRRYQNPDAGPLPAMLAGEDG